jgi:hypothetical protein
MNKRFVLRFVAAAAAIPFAASLAACNIERQEIPSLVGPSEFGLSLSLSAVPDAVNRDGWSKSVVTMVVRDAEGRPVADQRVLLALTPANGGTITDDSVVTGPDGRAAVDFTAPSDTTDVTAVSIQATPVGQNFSNSVPRSISIALVGPTGQ